MTGKNFSCNNTGKRHDSDFYQTPYCLTRLLLQKESLTGSVLEPACGKGAIVKCLPRCDAYYDEETDFFKETRSFGTVITNPPFSKAEETIREDGKHKTGMMVYA